MMTIPVIGIERLRMGLDGEGIRTLIGTAGCPLRCRYCLNPHAWNAQAEVKAYTPDELYEQVQIDNLYFQVSGGGLTFGGGEPLLHMPALSRLAELCPDTWSLWVETALFVPQQQLTLAAQVFDHFLVDIKTTNADIYRRYTGQDGSVAWENLKLLVQLAGAERITVRLPLIPGYVTAQDRSASAEAVRALGITDIDYLTYQEEGIF